MGFIVLDAGQATDRTLGAGELFAPAVAVVLLLGIAKGFQEGAVVASPGLLWSTRVRFHGSIIPPVGGS